ncbi:MAG: hypothetical protein H6739_00730 [Alphaproteobacteria bacterium]|nr:hypothetical protein [Alphaproteobacteria bacterium]
MRTLLAATLVAIACLAVTWPGVLADGALGHPTGDLADHYWGAWWVSEGLLQGRWPTETALTHQPEGGALWHIDPVGAALVTLLRPLGFPLAWNAMLTLQVLAAGLMGFAMGLAFAEGDRVAAVGAGVTMGASAYAVSLLHSGLSEYLGLVWPALYVWALLRALDTGERWWWAALALAMCTAQAFYYGAFGLLVAACAVPGAGGLRRAWTVAKVAALWALVSAPLMAVAWRTLHGEGSAFALSEAPGWDYRSLPATDLMSWLRPGAWYHPDTPAMGNPGILHVNYLGWLTLGVALLGALGTPRGRSVAPTAGLYAALALGPVASWGRAPLRVGGAPLLLPLAALYLPGSPFAVVHHPYRMVAFLLPLLALLVAAGLHRLPLAIAAPLPALMLIETLFASPAPWPAPVTPLPSVAAVRSVEADGALLDWPPDATAGNRRYLMAQVAHGRPIAAGVNTFLSETLRRDPLVASLLRALEDPVARARNRDVPYAGPVVLPAEGRATRLGALGFGHVAVHDDLLSPLELERTHRLLRRALGAPVAQADGVVIYAVEQR